MRNRLLLKHNVLYSVLLSIGISSSAFAVNTVNEFYNDPGKLLRSANALRWLNPDQTVSPANAEFSVEQTKESMVILNLYKVDGQAGAATGLAGIYITDYDRQGVNDITFPELPSVLNPSFSGSSGLCTLSATQTLCNVKMKAGRDVPVGGKSRRIYYEQAEDSDLDLNDEWRFVHVYEYVGGGTVDASSDLEHKVNNITAMAVSDNASQDAVPITITVHNSENANLAHLVFDVETAGKNTIDISKQVCDINISSGGGECKLNVTPKQIGKTKIKFDLANSYYQKTGGTQYKYDKIDPIDVHVGTLYAGYQHNVVHRKNSDFTITDQKFGVKGLVVDGVNHTLYASDGTNLYKQTNLGQSDIISLAKFANLTSGKVSTLSLTEKQFQLMAGSTNTGIYKVIDNGIAPGTVTLAKTTENSVSSSNLDVSNKNIAYFSDMSNSFYLYYGGIWAKEEHVLAGKYDHLHVVGDEGNTFGTADFVDTNGTQASDIFYWKGHDQGFVVIDTANESPFRNGVNIGNIFLNPQTRVLYASGSNGHIYSLNYPVGSVKPEWRKVTIDPIGATSINDYSVDNNGHMYIAAGFSGIWKIPANNGTAYKINNYSPASKNALTVAVDNNLL